MYQVYLLTVIVNIFGGILLASGFFKEKFPSLEQLEKFLADNKAYVTMLSLALLILGVLKLIVPAAPAASIAQDLVPALLAIISGVSLFYGYYKKVSDIDSGATSFMDKYVYKYRDIIGILTALSGLVHFILPRVILL
jgi:predicted neutral ceramidase superfamily lipid hydrolase